MDEGATLLGSTNFSDWPVIAPMPSYGQGRDHPGPRRASLIHGFNLTDIIVTGKNSTIDGTGFRIDHAEMLRKLMALSLAFSGGRACSGGPA